MTYAPHRSGPTREVPSHEDGTDLHRWRTRLWVAGGVAISAGLVAFGVWAVVTTPATVMITAAEPAGAFDFDVTALRCGMTSVSSEGLEEKAAGQFCLLDLKVTNNGDEPETFVSAEQHVRDTNGVAYAVAEQAAAFLNDRSPTLLGELQPGETATGVLPFDVPSDVQLSEAVLSAGTSAEGVRIALPDPR